MLHYTLQVNLRSRWATRSTSAKTSFHPSFPVCTAVYEVLQPVYVKCPTTTSEWKNVAVDFFTLWNYPLCLGALDGKRVLIQKPTNSGSDFYDYKGHCSIILLALVDAHYKFLYIDVGTNRRASDGSVFAKCTLLTEMQLNLLNIPPPEKLPHSHSFSLCDSWGWCLSSGKKFDETISW